MPGTQPAVVLVETQEEGNVGATARAMANMGLERLILVQPRIALGATARAFAVGAAEILDAAERAGSLAEALGPFRRVVGTTSARSRELPVPVLSPRELPPRLAIDPPGTPTALVFGREASGLTNDELALCSLLVRVPCAPRQPTLNLSQAVLVVAYELFVARAAGATARGEGGGAAGATATPNATAAADAGVLELAASTAEIEGLFGQLAPLLAAVGFARDDTFDAVLRDLRRLAARSAPTSREVQILRGICRRAGHALDARNTASGPAAEAPIGRRGG